MKDLPYRIVNGIVHIIIIGPGDLARMTWEIGIRFVFMPLAFVLMA
jgi:hypothetical protein